MMNVETNQGGSNRNEVEGFIGKPEVARRLGKHVRTVENWMQSGILPYYKVGHAVVFRWSEVEVQLRERCRVCRG